MYRENGKDNRDYYLGFRMMMRIPVHIVIVEVGHN